MIREFFLLANYSLKMPISTPFGENTDSQCDISPDLLLAELRADARQPPDLTVAIEQAIAEPSGYPGLASSTVPGDVVLVAIGKELVDVESIVMGVVQYFRRAHLADRLLRFLLPSEADVALVEKLRQSTPEFVEVLVHDPADAQANSFLTSGSDNQPIILSRFVCDADVVIPVNACHDPDRFDYFGPFSAVYPNFSDVDTKKRWNSPLFVTRKERRARRIRVVEEVRSLLGVVYTLLLIPANDHGYCEAVFGETNEVWQRVQNESMPRWQPSIPQSAGVVLALLSGGSPGQTWHLAARALANVEHLVRPGGAILLFTEISERPGPAMRRIGEALEFTDFEAVMRKSRQRDSAIALQFASTQSQCKVYFRGRVPESILDDIDLIPVESDAECRKICEHYKDVVVVHDAQQMVPKFEDSE